MSDKSDVEYYCSSPLAKQPLSLSMNAKLSCESEATDNETNRVSRDAPISIAINSRAFKLQHCIPSFVIFLLMGDVFLQRFTCCFRYTCGIQEPKHQLSTSMEKNSSLNGENPQIPTWKHN